MKTHLAESQVPLTEGQTVWTLCQRQVPNTVWMFRWLPGEVDEAGLNRLTTCSKCVDAVQSGRNSGDQMYMYGVQNRAEWKSGIRSRVGEVEECA